MSKYSNRRSDSEWLQIIQKCRQSGMSDSSWCEQHDIYNHIHVLLQTDLTPCEVGQVLFGATSRLLRKEFPQLISEAEKELWGRKILSDDKGQGAPGKLPVLHYETPAG